jgi:hypothetical protein
MMLAGPRQRLKASLASIALLISAFSLQANAQQSQLGKVVFPTSGSDKAQVHFMRGLAALHSFWFEEALDEFRESTKADTDFVMGYWGEAMAHNHPLWAEQDTEAGRKDARENQGHFEDNSQRARLCRCSASALWRGRQADA